MPGPGGPACLSPTLIGSRAHRLQKPLQLSGQSKSSRKRLLPPMYSSGQRHVSACAAAVDSRHCRAITAKGAGTRAVCSAGPFLPGLPTPTQTPRSAYTLNVAIQEAYIVRAEASDAQKNTQKAKRKPGHQRGTAGSRSKSDGRNQRLIPDRGVQYGWVFPTRDS